MSEKVKAEGLFSESGSSSSMRAMAVLCVVVACIIASLATIGAVWCMVHPTEAATPPIDPAISKLVGALLWAAFIGKAGQKFVEMR